MTLSDPVSPSTNGATGSLFAGGWLRGSQTAQVSGSDAVGIKSFAVVRDGEVVAQDPQECDYGKVTPCASPGVELASELPPVDTAGWVDGVHQVSLRVVDGGDNVTDTPAVEVKVDNTAPAAPTKVRNGRGAVWAARRSQTLKWDAPTGQAAPIVGSTLSACRGKKQPRCVKVTATAAGEAKVVLPRQGLYRGGVYLTDEAGNVSPANAAKVAVGYDSSKPKRPRLGAVTRGKGRTRSVRVRFRDAGAAPIARLSARLCRPGRTAGCTRVRTSDTKRVRTALKRGSGRIELRVRVVDAAGNRSVEARRRIG